jgi:hypothetical protein
MQIDPKDYNYKALAVGMKIKVPHIGCSSSAAMKISIHVEGASFYCHKCGGHAFVPCESRSWRDRRARKAEYEAVQLEKSRGGFDLPADFSQKISTAGLSWLGSGGWTADLITRYGVGWSEKLNRVVIPLQPAGYTARAVFKDQQPKYVDKAPGGAVWDSQPLQPGALVVTEDILSAGRVGKFVQTRALLGTPKRWLPPVGIAPLIIWTDDDAAGQKSRRFLEDNCKWLGIPVLHIVSAKDPKRYNEREIREILCSNHIGQYCSF